MNDSERPGKSAGEVGRSSSSDEASTASSSAGLAGSGSAGSGQSQAYASGALTPAEQEFATIPGRLRIMLADPLRGYSLANGRYEPLPQLAQRYIVPLMIAAVVLRCFFALFTAATFFETLGWGIAHIVILLLTVLAVGHVATLLAPKFKGTTTPDRGSVWFGLGLSPGYLGDIIGAVPYVGWLMQLALGLYGLYVLFVGTHSFLGIPRHRAAGFLLTLMVTLGAAYLIILYIFAKLFVLSLSPASLPVMTG